MPLQDVDRQDDAVEHAATLGGTDSRHQAAVSREDRRSGT